MLTHQEPKILSASLARPGSISCLQRNQCRQLEPGIRAVCAEEASHKSSHHVKRGLQRMALTVVVNHQEFIRLNGLQMSFSAAGSC